MRHYAPIYSVDTVAVAEHDRPVDLVRLFIRQTYIFRNTLKEREGFGAEDTVFTLEVPCGGDVARLVYIIIYKVVFVGLDLRPIRRILDFLQMLHF